MNRNDEDKPIKIEIYRSIKYYIIRKEQIKPGKHKAIQKATDLIYIKNETTAFNGFLSYLLIGLIFFLISYSYQQGNNSDDAFSIYAFTALLFGMSFYYLISFITDPFKELILNRVSGSITFSLLNGRGKTQSKPFDTLNVYEVSSNILDTSYEIKTIFFKNEKNSFCWKMTAYHHYEYWSFMVWYMDKNRPLPPGTAFDPYREKDFERRKAEGFRKPLYKSKIPTPEATPEQQKEREKIGGW